MKKEHEKTHNETLNYYYCINKYKQGWQMALCCQCKCLCARHSEKSVALVSVLVIRIA